MKNSIPARILVLGVIVFALLGAPALARTTDDILSRYQSPSGSTSLQSMIDRIVAPAPPADDSPITRDLHDLYPDLPEEGIIGEQIDFIDNEPSGSEGRYICPPDRPVGQLHHSWCMCISYRNVETGEVVNSECTNPETGHPYPMGIDDAGRTFIVHEDCPSAWADDDREPDSLTYHDIPIPSRSRFLHDTHQSASKIQDILNRH
jgi:hypothetical protein